MRNKSGVENLRSGSFAPETGFGLPLRPPPFLLGYDLGYDLGYEIMIILQLHK